MVDVVRLLRLGDREAAAAIHRDANDLARHRATMFVAKALLDGTADPDPAVIDETTGGALTRLATLTASARSRHLASLRVDCFLGRVTDVSGHVAYVLGEDGRTFPIPSPASSGNPWTGALVAVDTELFEGGATTMWIRPAFDTEADPHARVVGGPHVLTPAERDRLGRLVAADR